MQFSSRWFCAELTDFVYCHYLKDCLNLMVNFDEMYELMFKFTSRPSCSFDNLIVATNLSSFKSYYETFELNGLVLTIVYA